MSVQLTERDLRIIQPVIRYGHITRRQLQRLVDMPERIARRRLKQLATARYLNRYEPGVAVANAEPPTPIYYPSKLGCQVIAEHLSDDRVLLTRTTLAQRTHVPHALAVTETHLALDFAIGRQSDVELVGWFNEHAVVNSGESDRGKHRTTQIPFDALVPSRSPIACKPDSVFALKANGATCICLLEEERDLTHSARQRIASKLPGFEKLYQTKKHVSHFEAFPGALDTFRVLFVAPNAKRRDALRRATNSLMQNRTDGLTEVWWFVAKDELTPESFLHEPVFYPCNPDAKAIPLVNLKIDASDEAA